MRRSSPLPAQLVQVAVAGFAPSAVFQMALNSVLVGIPVEIGSARPNEETIITRALTGLVVPFVVWL